MNASPSNRQTGNSATLTFREGVMARLRSIVLVESNPLDAMTVRRVFAQAGQEWSLVHCLDGIGGLTYFQRPKDDIPRLVILDLDNDRDDNLALLRYLKQDAAYRHLPVLVLAGGNHNGALVEYQNLGADDYLIKPPDYALFSKEIAHFLRRWAARAIAAA
jgi:CheY-like chemotaxis protein